MAVVPVRTPPPPTPDLHNAVRVVAYVTNDRRVFVHARLRTGGWLLTDPCVLVVRCPACDAALGAACIGDGSEVSTCHVDRKYFARRMLRTREAPP